MNKNLILVIALILSSYALSTEKIRTHFKNKLRQSDGGCQGVLEAPVASDSVYVPQEEQEIQQEVATVDQADEVANANEEEEQNLRDSHDQVE
jgi:uncharacterized protein YgiM (DUF1202 family)